MEFMEWVESRTSRLTVWDVGLLKWRCIVAGVVVARLVPSLRRINTGVLAAASIGLAVKPAVTALGTKTRPR